MLDRSAEADLDITFVLGPKEKHLHGRASIFQTVARKAFPRTRVFRVIVNEREITVDFVEGFLKGMFTGGLPRLESLEINVSEARHLGWYHSFQEMMQVIDTTSLNLKSIRLEHLKPSAIRLVAVHDYWKLLRRITIREWFTMLEITNFSGLDDLEFLSFSGHLEFPSSGSYPIKFPQLKELYLLEISMSNLACLSLPELHTMVTREVTQDSPAPLPGSVCLPALKELLIGSFAGSTLTLACITAPALQKLDLTMLGSLEEATKIFNWVFNSGNDSMMRPQCLIFRGPHMKNICLGAAHDGLRPELRLLEQEEISLDP